MDRTFEIKLNDSKIGDYEEILSRFGNWKKYKREINLNQLLEEDKKIQFDVEISNNQSVFYVSVSNDFQYTTALTNVCSVINKFTFIILNNKVIDLRIDITFLDTKWGKEIQSILESGVELQLNHHKNIKGQIDNFYFELPKQAA